MQPFYLFIILFSLTTTFVLGQNISKKYSLRGFLQVNDTLFVSTSEVSIRDYAYFLIDTRKYDSAQFVPALPNETPIDWRVKSFVKAEFTTYDRIYEIGDSTISWHTMTWFYPIVNVTKAQASLYCNYLTQNYSRAKNNFTKKEEKKSPPNLVYRLPTESEWIAIASSFLDTSLYTLGHSRKGGKNIFPICLEYFNDTSGIERHPLGSQSGWNFGLKNDLGVFNMVGNVSEMVIDTDNIMGGSFIDSVSECKVTSRKKMVGPDDFIGFRVVAVVRK